MMRIWHQSMAPLDQFGDYQTLLERHLTASSSDGTAVTVHGATPGSYLGQAPGRLLRYPYARHVVQSQAIEHCLQAEREGYDAVAFATFGDPFLTECRSLVDIPVTSIPESSLLVGCSLAKQMALVPLGPGYVRQVQELVARIGLSSRVSAVVPLDPPATEADLVEALLPGRGDDLVSRFSRAAQTAIRDGADLIVPAEGLLNEVLFQSNCTRIGDVVVMDVLAVLVAHTELLVDLKARAELSVGRKWSYPRPDPELLAELHQWTRSTDFAN